MSRTLLQRGKKGHDPEPRAAGGEKMDEETSEK